MLDPSDGRSKESVALKNKMDLAQALEEKIRLQVGLPHLHGWKWYPWAREFFESTNKINLLCAANQISKSSTQIRKAIHWATSPDLWPSLWKNRPTQFWYLYPTRDVTKIEYETKWCQFLPGPEYKNHPQYGWDVEIANKSVFAIRFRSGVNIYFKTYAQDAQHLQSGTVDALYLDEEVPSDLFDELMFRLSASNGYFHMVFTATLGQEYWRLAMEPGPDEKENLPHAWKRTVSMFDCIRYEDGTPTHWTPEKIQMIENRCSSHNEILRRVWGRFLLEERGRKYEQFDSKRHMREKAPIPKGWFIYAGCDVGSGGADGHPSSICFVAVDPDFRRGRVFLGWRGDGIITTAADVVEKFKQMKAENSIACNVQTYDWACRDFFTIATQMGEGFIPAEKSHELGEQVINVLFKNDMLSIDNDPELHKLATELATLRKSTAKTRAADDFSDAMRYALTKIPWDWSVIIGDKPASWVQTTPVLSDLDQQVADRRAQMSQKAEEEGIDEEFKEWNEQYG